MLAHLSNHRRIAGAALLGGVALVVFVLAYFQPQKLVIDDTVDEALPVAMSPSPPDAPADAEAPPAGPAVRELSSGGFRSHEHETTGRARIIELPDGARYVRFEDFRTSNGPQLKVYLSAAAAGGPGSAFDDRFVDLGDLKGNVGDQNYAIPRDAPLRSYRSVVVWCERFSVAFGAADLT